MYTVLDLPADDYGCVQLITNHLYPEGLVCPWKRHSEVLVRERYLWCRSCRRKWSLKRLLGFGYAKLSWRQILALVLGWVRMLSPGDILGMVGMSYETIKRWLERLRKRLPNDQTKLAGLVEIDQSYLGRKKHGNQVLVMGVVERETNEVRIQVIPDMAQDSIEEFLDDHVEPESLVHADCHASHLALEDVGYGLVLCNHDQGHFGPTNRIEGVWSSFDRFVIRTRVQFLKRFLPGILQEFCARKNHPELFTDPLTFLTLTSNLNLCSISVE